MEPNAQKLPNPDVRRQTSIGELMTRCPHTIGSDQTLATAHKLMREHHLRHLPVLRGGRLVGVLTQRDLYFLETIAGVDLEIDKVADAMSPEVYTVTPEERLRDVARTMATRKLGCAVVVEKGQVVGIFTATDALRHLGEMLG
jgi:acetoin utilization protein AcuB